MTSNAYLTTALSATGLPLSDGDNEESITTLWNMLHIKCRLKLIWLANKAIWLAACCWASKYVIHYINKIIAMAHSSENDSHMLVLSPLSTACPSITALGHRASHICFNFHWGLCCLATVPIYLLHMLRILARQYKHNKVQSRPAILFTMHLNHDTKVMLFEWVIVDGCIESVSSQHKVWVGLKQAERNIMGRTYETAYSGQYLEC